MRSNLSNNVLNLLDFCPRGHVQVTHFKRTVAIGTSLVEEHQTLWDELWHASASVSKRLENLLAKNSIPTIEQ